MLMNNKDKKTKIRFAGRNILLAVNTVQTSSAQLSWDGLIS